MKNVVKIFSIVLILLYTIGCSNNSIQEPSNNTISSTQTAKPTELETDQNMSNLDELEQYNEKVVFKIYQDYNNKIFMELLINNQKLIEQTEILFDEKKHIMENNVLEIDEQFIDKIIGKVEIIFHFSDDEVKKTEYKKVMIQNVKGKESLFFNIDNSYDIENLWIINSVNLVDISELSEIKNLKTVSFDNCKSLKDLTPLLEKTELENLYFFQSVPDNLAGLSKLSKLKSLLLIEYGEGSINTKEIMELKEIQYLNLYNFSSIDIANIECLLFLKELYINNSNVDNAHIESISKLAQLERLSIIACNEISDVSKLSDLTSLLYLNISNCKKVKDLSELKTLINLEIVELTKLELVDNIDFISNASNLKSISINNLKNVEDVSRLEANSKIEKCSLTSNNFDITPLMRNKNLKDLIIVDALEINSIEYATGLNKLEMIASYGFSSEEDLDITPIGKLINLEELYLSGYGIKSIEPLQSATKIRKLILIGENYQKIDTSSLSKLIKLEYLEISEHDGDSFIVSDLTFLEALNNLKYLKLNLTEISDYSPITHLYNLETLEISDAREAIPEEFGNLDHLLSLELRNCIFKGQENVLSAIGGLKNLEKLYIYECYNYNGEEYTNLEINFIEGLVNLNDLFVDCLAAEVSKFPNLKNLNKLKKLHVYEFKGSDISGMWEAPNIEVLWISDSILGDITLIKNFTELKELWFNNNIINDYSPILQLNKITEITIIPLYNEYYDFSDFYDMENVNVIID